MPRQRLWRATRVARLLTWGLALIGAAMAIAACGKTSSTASSTSSAASSAAATSSTASAAASTTAAASGSIGSACGQVPSLGYKDLSGVVAGLGSTYKASFNGYPTPIFKSAYAAFKHKSGPITIGISVTQPVSPFNAALIPAVEAAAHAVKGVTSVKLLTSSPTGLTQQLQQTNSLIDDHVSFLIVEPLASPPFIPVAARAEKAGIPFISIVNSTPSPDSINIAPNSVLDAATAAAKLATLVGEKGTVIGVHGIPGAAVDTQTFAGFKDAFKHCPNIKLEDSLVGQFQPEVAKQQTLSYLSSHPQPVAGAVETAGMGPGILQAFQQTGRPVPTMVDAGAELGDLAFWQKNPSKLASAYTITPSGVAGAVSFTIEHLLAGHGPKISELSQPSLVVDSSNLSQFVKSGTAVTDEAPIDGPWDPASYLAPLFN